MLSVWLAEQRSASRRPTRSRGRGCKRGSMRRERRLTRWLATSAPTPRCTPDPDAPRPLPRQHPRRVEGRVRLRRRLDVRRAARDGGGSSTGADLSLVTANAIFLAPVPPGPITIDVDVLRDGRRRVAGRGRPPRAGRRRRPRCACTACSAPRTTPSSRTKRCGSPKCRARPTRPMPPDRPNPFGQINFHEQTEWRPVSPLDDPGKGQFLSWVRLLEGEPDLLSLAVHGDVLGPAVGRALGAARPERHVHGAVARDRHPLRAGAGDVVGAAGDRGVAHRRRLRDRPRAPVGRRPATSARSPPRPRTSGITHPRSTSPPNKRATR